MWVIALAALCLWNKCAKRSHLKPYRAIKICVALQLEQNWFYNIQQPPKSQHQSVSSIQYNENRNITIVCVSVCVCSSQYGQMAFYIAACRILKSTTWTILDQLYRNMSNSFSLAVHWCDLTSRSGFPTKNEKYEKKPVRDPFRIAYTHGFARDLNSPQDNKQELSWE